LRPTISFPAESQPDQVKGSTHPQEHSAQEKEMGPQPLIYRPANPAPNQQA
jgi:hypothetical protein